MTVQIPDPGTGNGQTGDNEYVFRKKVKDNFSDQTNAASRLLGAAPGQVPLAENTYKAAFSNLARRATDDAITDANNLPSGTRYYLATGSTNTPNTKHDTTWNIETRQGVSSNVLNQIALGGNNNTAGMYLRNRNSSSAWGDWSIVYTNRNTTVDGNGLLKPSSPVLRVFSDHIEGNNDADIMQAVFTKNGVGDYTISNTTGLRTNGWYITIPNDMNGNPKVAVTLSEKDGVVSLKSYKRIFDMSDFIFKPDLEQPLEIPDGRWIDLRFEELPIDDTQTEV